MLKSEWYELGHKEKYQWLKNELGVTQEQIEGSLRQEKRCVEGKESESLVNETNIISSTLIKSQLPSLSETKFDVVSIDEYSQVSITH